MKHFLSLLLFSFCSFSYAQKQVEVSLTKVWKLKSHTMTGIGIHRSLPENTQIEFFTNGTWKSSSPWQGASQGKWSLINEQKTLHMTFAPSDENDFRVSAFSKDQLQLVNTTKIAVYKLTWEALN